MTSRRIWVYGAGVWWGGTLYDVAEDLEGELALDGHGMVVDQVVQRPVLLQEREIARERKRDSEREREREREGDRDREREIVCKEGREGILQTHTPSPSPSPLPRPLPSPSFSLSSFSLSYSLSHSPPPHHELHDQHLRAPFDHCRRAHGGVSTVLSSVARGLRAPPRRAAAPRRGGFWLCAVALFGDRAR